MSLDEREIYINACRQLEAELEGVPVYMTGRLPYAELSDEDLLKEHDWLYELVYLK